MEKDKYIKSETKKLNKIKELVPDENKVIATNLIKEIAFMSATLEELKGIVGEKGAVEDFKNGKQEFMRESPALKSYTALIPRYSNLYKQLISLVPEEVKETNSELLDFINE